MPTHLGEFLTSKAKARGYENAARLCDAVRALGVTCTRATAYYWLAGAVRPSGDRARALEQLLALSPEEMVQVLVGLPLMARPEPKPRRTSRPSAAA